MPTEPEKGGLGEPDPLPTAPPPPPPPEARAKALQDEIDRLRARVQELERLLAEATSARDTSDRKRRIHAALAAANVLDVEAAEALLEQAVASLPVGGAPPDVESLVRDLRRRKPGLFRSPTRTGVMSAAPGDTPPSLDDLAAEAGASGDRRSLLKYLRARRAR